MLRVFNLILVLVLFCCLFCCQLLIAEKGSFSFYRYSNSLTGEIHEVGRFEFEKQKSRDQ